MSAAFPTIPRYVELAMQALGANAGRTRKRRDERIPPPELSSSAMLPKGASAVGVKYSMGGSLGAHGAALELIANGPRAIGWISVNHEAIEPTTFERLAVGQELRLILNVGPDESEFKLAGNFDGTRFDGKFTIGGDHRADFHFVADGDLEEIARRRLLADVVSTQNAEASASPTAVGL